MMHRNRADTVAVLHINANALVLYGTGMIQVNRDLFYRWHSIYHWRSQITLKII